MKKLIALIVSCMLLMAVIPAFAQSTIVQESAAIFDLEITLPEGVEMTQEMMGDVTLVLFEIPANGDDPIEYMLTVAPGEEFDGSSATPITKNDLGKIIEMQLEDMANGQVEFFELADGATAALVDENDADSDFAFVITVYGNYYIELHFAHSNMATQLTREELDAAISIFKSLKVEPLA